jgi:hypothetical protein
MDEEMESRSDLTSPGTRTIFASAPEAVPSPGCRAGVITELSVIIPVYNDAVAILETIDEVGKALPECGLEAFEIVVEDDGSTDGSVELVADLALVAFLWLLLSFTLYAPVVRDIIFVTFLRLFLQQLVWSDFLILGSLKSRLPLLVLVALLVDAANTSVRPLARATVPRNGSSPGSRFPSKKVALRIESDAPGYVQVSYPWYPDTEVLINGKKVVPLHGPLDLTVLPLQQGTNEIEILPTNPLLVGLAALSCLALLITVGVAFGSIAVEQRVRLLDEPN